MKPSAPRASSVRKASRVAPLVIAVMVFVGDQVTKAVVERSIPEHALITVVPGFFNFTNTKNPGIAFGLFSDSPAPWKTALLIAISGALLLTVLGIMWRSRQLERWTALGLALILGGALSNLFDRIRWGRVGDFLDFYFRGYHWPAFNLADSAIVVGAGLLVCQMVFAEWGN